jgi:hypothetical protein
MKREVVFGRWIFVAAIMLIPCSFALQAEGRIAFTGTDNDGWAKVRTVLYRWDDQNRIMKQGTRSGRI